MTSVIGRAVLPRQAGAQPGTLSTELEREATFVFSVHQAAGIVAVQGSISVGDALVAIRAHAFAVGASLSELAVSVVARDVHFHAVGGTWRSARGSEL